MTEQRQGGAGRSGARSESEKAAEEVRAGIGDAAEHGKERARSFLDDQRSAVAEQAHDFAGALRDTARGLEDRGEDSTASHLAERAAQGIDQIADSLREKDLNVLVRDTQRFARSSPALFIGGSIVAGLLIGRFLRSSEPRRSRSYGSSSARHGVGEGQRDEQRRGLPPELGRSDPSRFGGNPGTPASSTSTTQRSPGAQPPAGGQR